MRLTLGLLGFALIAIFISLSLADTDDYALEKQLWRMDKVFTVIAHAPENVTGQKFGRTIDKYQQLIKKFPRARQIPIVYLQIGRLYKLQGQRVEARTHFQIILDKYPQSANFGAAALFEICKTYEEEGRAAQAISAYQEILERYPLSNIGLDIPLYIVDYYRRIGENRKAEMAVKNAIIFYQKMAESSEFSNENLKILRKLATAYVFDEDWVSALKALERLFLEFGEELGPKALDGVIKSINSIAVMQLKDYDRAIDIYQKFVQKSPEEALTPKVKEIIRALEQLKKPDDSQ